MSRRRRAPPDHVPDAVDRRTFLKKVAIASTAAAGSAIAPGLAAGASADVPTPNQRGPVWKKAPCHLCGVGCGLLVAIQNGRAVAVRGDPDSPVSRGLACVKGYHSVQSLYGNDRITGAMVRRNGKLVAVPLAEALDVVARALRETRERHGRDSVAVYGSAQWTVADGYVASKLFSGALGTKHVETSVRLDVASARAGLESSFGLDGSVGCYEDVEHADVFVLWDANLAETDPVLFSRLLARRRTSTDVRIIDLSTRTTRTSYAADQSLLYAPQGQLVVANAVCHEIVARKWVNREFVDRHVAFKRGRTGIGYALTGDVRSDDAATDATWSEYAQFLSAYTPAVAQRVAGVPAESLRWLASVYADRSRKVMSVWGAGVNQRVRGTWMNNLLYNIHLLVGKIASPGNGAFGLTGQPGGGGVAHRPTQDAISMFRALEGGQIRFLWIQASDPMIGLPNLRRYRAAVARADAFVVVSEAYPTATTDVADVVLPTAMWIEREGVFVNAERRAQHFEQMLSPPGSATSTSWQMIDVARRLGYARLFPAERDAVGHIWGEYAHSQTGPKRAVPALADLRARPGVLWPHVNGRETKWRYNTAYDPAADRTRGAFDFYGHADHRAWVWLRPHEPPAEVPDHDYPFWLDTGAVLEHSGTGSMTRRIPTLHRAVPRAYVEINEHDAERLGIANGETVRVLSRRGSLDIEARVNLRSQPPRGRLFVPSFDESLAANLLTLDACCPLSGQPDYGNCAVRIERLTARGAP